MIFDIGGRANHARMIHACLYVVVSYLRQFIFCKHWLNIGIVGFPELTPQSTHRVVIATFWSAIHPLQLRAQIHSPFFYSTLICTLWLTQCAIPLIIVSLAIVWKCRKAFDWFLQSDTKIFKKSRHIPKIMYMHMSNFGKENYSLLAEKFR